MSTPNESQRTDYVDQLIDAFLNCGWARILEDVAHEGYFATTEGFRSAAAQAEKNCDSLEAKVFRLLSDACSMTLTPEKPNEPFQPWFVGGGRRSTVSDDFGDCEIEFFAQITDSIDDPLLKARLADLVWFKKQPRDVRFALDAIDSYKQFSLEGDMWFRDGQQCMQRAIGLCQMIGTAAGNRLDKIEKAVINKIESSSIEDGFLSYGLAETLSVNGLGTNHVAGIGSKLESLAREFDTSEKFLASGRFFDASSKWFRRAGEEMKSLEMIVARAEASVKEAEERMSSDDPSHAVAASFLENAVQIYRAIPRNRRRQNQVDERIRELRLRISEHGQSASEELATVSGPEIDISEYVERARNAVKGKSLEKALLEFANLHSVKVARLRQAATDTLSQSSLRALFPTVFSSHDGRVIDRTPSISDSTPSENDEKVILAEMTNFHYQPDISLAVQALILPTLDVLIVEHRISEAALIELARRSPIVPLGREMLFGKALAHGFNKDFVTAIHLLGPQIEHMVRFHLKEARVVTTHLDQNGIEMEYGLSTLIDLKETTAIFGEDLTYELKALYCDQIGPNLRNNIAHGLLDDRQCYSLDSIYAWWLGLKIVFNVFWNSLATGADSDESEQASEDELAED